MSLDNESPTQYDSFEDCTKSLADSSLEIDHEFLPHYLTVAAKPQEVLNQEDVLE